MEKSMDSEHTNDEQNQSISKETYPSKLRLKERSRSQTTPTTTDINDPENLDYEDVDDHHPVKNLHDEGKSSAEFQDEDGEVSSNAPEINTASSSVPNNPEADSDEGEVDEADLEDGEIHDPSTSKQKNSSSDDQLEQNRAQTNTGVPSSPQAKVHCRFFLQGRCHWGPNCKYIHPNNDTTKNSTGAVLDGLPTVTNDISPPTSAGVPLAQVTTNAWISPQATIATAQFFPNSLLRGQAPPSSLALVPPTGTESAWERGLRSAKTLREQSMRRKQQDKDFNEKKFNLTIRDALDEKEIDDNLLNIDRPSSIDYNLNDYVDQRGYSDRYHPYSYSAGNSHYNNPSRMNSNSRHNDLSSTNEHPDRRPRHSEDYIDNRSRKEKSSIKESKSTSKREDSSSYKRNSAQQQYSSGPHRTNDDQLHMNNYGPRRGDTWNDPWDRSRNHPGSNRRSSGGARGPSYTPSASSSSSSRSTRSHSTSSSSRSRSRSRSRPKRRSPSVTRATTNKSFEATKNGNEKKSNGSKKTLSPSSTTKKFLPGRQISSHTLKKAEKSSNSSKSSTNHHSKTSRGKDSDINTKKKNKKETISRLDSNSSSSSSDSGTNRAAHRSSSSSSDSSSSENETRTKSKTTSAGKTVMEGKKSASRQLSTSAEKKSKNDSSTHTSAKSKETSAKKRRDTSSSTGSTNATKKTKLNTDSHKSSTDVSNTENSDSSKKKEKQKILQKLQEVEKLINQRSSKTSS